MTTRTTPENTAPDRARHDHEAAGAAPTAPTSWFWRYYTGSTVSRVGTAVTTVALPLTALAAAHATSFEVGAVTAAGYAAWAVVGLPAGVLVGRLPLRETQIAMDLVRAAALASVPLAWWLASVTVAQLVVVALIVGVASGGNEDKPVKSLSRLAPRAVSVTVMAGPAQGERLRAHDLQRGINGRPGRID